MKIIPTAIRDVLVMEPEVFDDERGFFFESFHAARFAQAVGRSVNFVQDNHSRSVRGVLRGLHYQVRQTQGKLVRVIAGEVFDVAVDLRKNSTTFGRWVGATLSAENRRQLWVPAGFAHGFVVMSAAAEVLYKTTDYWAAEHERCIIWNDHSIAIDWPLPGEPVLSAKDKQGVLLADAEVFG